MANTFAFKLLSPYKSLFEGQVEAVMLPGERGEFGVLSNHTKFATSLRSGVVRFVADGQTHRYAIGGGFSEVHTDGVVVLADSAEAPDKINLQRAEESRDKAKADLQRLDPADTSGRARLEAHLARAENRIRVAKSS